MLTLVSGLLKTTTGVQLGWERMKGFFIIIEPLDPM